MTNPAGGTGLDRKLTKAEVKSYIKDQTKISPVKQAKAQAAKMAMKLAVKSKGGS